MVLFLKINQFNSFVVFDTRTVSFRPSKCSVPFHFGFVYKADYTVQFESNSGRMLYTDYTFISSA